MRDFLLIAFVLAFACVNAGEVPDTLRSERREHLRDVVVTGRRPFGEVIPGQTLGGPRLERLGNNSVADAMRYFSGVQLKDYGGVGGIRTVDMRSMGSNHMGVVYDGLQLGNAQNGQIDLGKYSLDNIESISVYNGQRSEIFQPARDFGSAAIVYITSRRPRFDSGEKYKVGVTMRAGSFGLLSPSVRTDVKLADNVSASVSVEYTYANGRYRFRYRRVYPSGAVAWDTTAVRHNGDVEALRLEGGLYGNYSNSQWQMKLYYYDSERGIPGAIVNNVWKTSQRQWDRNFFAQGMWQRDFTPSWSMKVNAKYARDYMRYLNPDTTLMYVNNRFYQDELYVSMANRVRVRRGWDVNLSVDYQLNHLDADMVDFANPLRNSLMAALASAAEFGPVKAQASLLATYVSDRTESRPAVSADEKSHRLRFTPALFASYRPWARRDFNVRAFVKQTFRMPTFNDLYYTDIGNAMLRPECATQWNLGATWHTDLPAALFSSIDLTADAYRNIVDDKIIAVPKGTGQYRWMMMNIGKADIRGVDLTATLSLEPADGLMLGTRLTYTYQRAMDVSDPSDCLDEAGTYRGQIAYVPRHSGSAVVSANWRAAEINYSFIYVGERYHTSSNIPANYELPWYTHDLSASYRLLWGDVSFRITAEVNNLLNQQYEVIQNYPMPGRNFKFTLKFEI